MGVGLNKDLRLSRFGQEGLVTLLFSSQRSYFTKTFQDKEEGRTPHTWTAQQKGELYAAFGKDESDVSVACGHISIILVIWGYNGDKDGYEIPAGTDVFLSVYNLHRSPYFWNKPNEFEPERFLVPKESQGIEGWAGFDPSRSPGALYPNEIISDFAFLPFGGGPRKCVGDQFALMESTIALAMLLQKFDVELKGNPESVELVTGATIHTKNGLWCKLKKRSDV